MIPVFFLHVSINITPFMAMQFQSCVGVGVRLFAGIAGSNPAWGIDVCLLWVLCVVR